MNDVSDSPSRGARWLAAGGAALVANSAYLAAAGDPRMLYFANVALHFVLGLALLVPFTVWWWRRRQRPGMLAAGLLLFAAAASGIALAWIGNTRSMRPLLWTHVGLAIAGLLALLFALRPQLAPRGWRLAAAGAALALLVPAAALAFQSWRASRRVVFQNPPAALAMADEAMAGEKGPFFPSSVHTSNGGVVPSRIYMDPQSCGRSGCHPDLVEQWQGSAHHFSSFNNQWYRRSVEYMQEVAGVTSSKWCGGCHDPAILQSGMMDTPIQQIIDRPETQAGLTCTACHMISAVRSSMGQGDYEIEVPPLHGLATSKSHLLNTVHDLLVRMDPEPHRRTFLKPFFRGVHSAELCSSCHKVHLDVPVNGYRWVRGFNEYDNWQASGVSGQGARSFYYPAESKNCVDCHMPRVPSQDAANKAGLIRSHRFAAANTALPVANRDPEQLRAVVDFLKAGQLTVDLFAMSEARAGGGGEEGTAQSEGPQLATTFAVGEESAMAVGTGGGAGGPAETIFAPLDRIPATVRRGTSTRVDVVVRTRGVGHFFPGGTVDAYDCWLELKAVDDRGRVVFWSGMADEDSPVEPGAHFYRSLLIDDHGNPINKRNAWASRATVYVRLIPPGAADTVHFRLDVPPDAGDEIRLQAKLNYRKFSFYNTHFSFAGRSLPGGAVTRDFDDRQVAFTGDTSRVSGKVKGVPRLPIVVVAEDSAVLEVVDAGGPLPDMERPALQEGDRERWNDYGIGLLLQGDLRAARAAFTKVTEIEPGYVDGWVNRGRVALGEGDLEEARRVLGRALTMQPELARTHHFLGVLDKELGTYDRALAHFRTTASQYPRDRVNLNQIGRVLFLKRDYAAAVAELQNVLAIDPEDLMAHYTLMLAYRGLGEMQKAAYHQKLYERFKIDESAQVRTGAYREKHPHDNNERQAIHEHRSVPAGEIRAFLHPSRPRAPAGSATVVSAGG